MKHIYETDENHDYDTELNQHSQQCTGSSAQAAVHRQQCTGSSAQTAMHRQQCTDSMMNEKCNVVWKTNSCIHMKHKSSLKFQ